MAKIEIPPYDRTVLVLQGGGALGSYQAGVFQGLSEAGVMPQMVAGISIGALNAAIIGGNPPAKRVQQLQKFWETICTPNRGWSLLPWLEDSPWNDNDYTRWGLGMLGGLSAIVDGQQGFFRPRFPGPTFIGDGRPDLASYYDTSDLKATLEKFCDFDLLNSDHCTMRVAVGAVNVRTGNFVYFDNKKEKLRAEHFMASGALPPAFAPVEIDGEFYWDGGIVSNTPLGYVLEQLPREDALIFQVDLWSARGKVPGNMLEVTDRAQEIRFSSRTRLVTSQWMQMQEMRRLVAEMLPHIPKEHEAEKWYKRAQKVANLSKNNVIHLIYRAKAHERQNKDYQFSLGTMRAHWQGGLVDIQQALTLPKLLELPDNEHGFVAHDVHRDEIEQVYDLDTSSLSSVKR